METGFSIVDINQLKVNGFNYDQHSWHIDMDIDIDLFTIYKTFKCSNNN